MWFSAACADHPRIDVGCGYPAGMKRVLLTMSGTGKSTVIRELARLGHKAIDLDEPGWSELANVASQNGTSAFGAGRDWIWREERVHDLLSVEDADVLFLSGCAPNQVKFYSQFDHIVLLSAAAQADSRADAEKSRITGGGYHCVRGSSGGDHREPGAVLSAVSQVEL
jgi:hypothetical protein